MGAFSNVSKGTGALTASDVESIGSSDPISLLDRIIVELEETRDEAVATSRSASPGERAMLAAALTELDEKLAAARAKRDEVRTRVARTARIRALAAEMATLRTESEAAARGEVDEVRARRVRARIQEIRDEADGLRTTRDDS